MDALRAALGDDQPAYRAQQLFAWLHRGAEIDEMTNLPQRVRERLAAAYIANPVTVRLERASHKDDTRKYLFELPDGNLIEGVLMRHHHGHTLCVSTQVGCRMGCSFCASTLGGLVRDCTPGEMLGQIVCVERRHAGEASAGEDGRRFLTNVVLMGSGEPLDNYDNVVAFLRQLTAPGGLHMSARNISLSTCGLVEGIDRLAAEGLPVTLSVSLHAPNDAIRRGMMPIARRVPMDELLAACRRWVEATGRRVILEYALVAGVNDAREHALELSRRLRGLQCHVNLIPLNAVRERDLRGSTQNQARQFLEWLTASGTSATIRREMGADIEGACGQLRRAALGESEPTQAAIEEESV